MHFVGHFAIFGRGRLPCDGRSEYVTVAARRNGPASVSKVTDVTRPWVPSTYFRIWGKRVSRHWTALTRSNDSVISLRTVSRHLRTRRNSHEEMPDNAIWSIVSFTSRMCIRLKAEIVSLSASVIVSSPESG
eukprot:7387992-Prymnesium_polylepis.1